MKYLLFGTGDYYERYKKWFPKEDVLALMDNSPMKVGTQIDGVNVMTPQDAVKLPYDTIVILSFYFVEMKNQLLELGVDETKIFHFYDLPKVLPASTPRREIKYWGVNSTNDEKKRVLLLSHDLTLGGPSLALLHGAKVLHKGGYQVVFASMLDGPLREDVLMQGISVIVDENLQRDTMEEVEWIKDFDLVICNTINYHVFLSRRKKDIPVIWWLHDSPFFYGGIDKELLKSIDTSNMKVVSVGPVPRAAMQEYRPSLEIGDLLYGVSFKG
ncbi:MAG: hypothetical protein IKJ73_07285 [Lachnospiraceae bacterium]|nr:hypothetical protein [Lachnospiraceae bacterium]